MLNFKGLHEKLQIFFSRTGRAGNKGTSYTFITPEQGK